MEVDFDTKKAVVTMQPGKTVTREQCAQAFTGTKYSIESFEPAAP